MPGRDALPVVVQFYRLDRENDLDPSLEQSDYEFYVHFYGDQIDRLLDELVGSENLDRHARWPTAEVPETGVKLELHEDGPTWMFLIEQLPQFIAAASAVFTAWMAWRSKRARSTRVEIGGHTYSGPARTPAELEAVVKALAALTPEESAST